MYLFVLIVLIFFSTAGLFCAFAAKHACKTDNIKNNTVFLAEHKLVGQLSISQLEILKRTYRKAFKEPQLYEITGIYNEKGTDSMFSTNAVDTYLDHLRVESLCWPYHLLKEYKKAPYTVTALFHNHCFYVVSIGTYSLVNELERIYKLPIKNQWITRTWAPSLLLALILSFAIPFSIMLVNAIPVIVGAVVYTISLVIITKYSRHIWIQGIRRPIEGQFIKDTELSKPYKNMQVGRISNILVSGNYLVDGNYYQGMASLSTYPICSLSLPDKDSYDSNLFMGKMRFILFSIAYVLSLFMYSVVTPKNTDYLNIFYFYNVLPPVLIITGIGLLGMLFYLFRTYFLYLKCLE